MEQVILFLEWWVWGLAAIILFALEVMVAGFVFLGFAVGAAIVALLLFAVISLLAWFAMRQVFGIRKGQVKVWDKDINDDV